MSSTPPASPDSPLSSTSSGSTKLSNHPSTWSEDNRPTRSILLDHIRAVCHRPFDTSASRRSVDQYKSGSSDPKAGDNNGNDNKVDIRTPPQLPQMPSISSLDTLSQTLSFYNYYSYRLNYLPILSAGPAYGLSVQPVDPRSLEGGTHSYKSSTESSTDPQSAQVGVSKENEFDSESEVDIKLATQGHYGFLRTTTLYFQVTSARKPLSLTTVYLGRIYYNNKPTFWIVVMEVEYGGLYALRSDFVAHAERAEVEDPLDDLSMPEMEEPALCPAFDDDYSLAVYLGNTTIWDKGFYTRGEKHRKLDVGRWESFILGRE